MISLMKRVIKQIANDKRSVMMILFAPLLILSLLYFLLGDSDYIPTVALEKDKMPAALLVALEQEDIQLLNIAQDIEAQQYLIDHQDVDMVFTFSTTGVDITIYESSSKSAKALKAVQSAIMAVNPAAKMTINTTIGEEDASFFANMGHIFFGLFSFFLIFLISGLSLVKERSSGTLERFLMSPISRRSVILGYTGGYSLFAVLQALIMLLYGIYVLDVNCVGNILWAILIMLLLAISAVCLGSLVSVFSNSELQVVQIIPIAIIPQIFFSGLIPLDTIPYGLGYLAYLTPVFYGCSALKEVMVAGGGISDIWLYLLGLFVYILILSILNTLALKKYRTI